MIELTISGRGQIQLDHLVSDVNGTLALDGCLMEGVAKAVKALSNRLEIHLLTADTHGQQEVVDRQLGMQAVRIPPGGEAEAKAMYHGLLFPCKSPQYEYNREFCYIKSLTHSA